MVYEEQLITCPTSIKLIGDQLAYNGGITIFLTMKDKFTMSIMERNDDKIKLIFPKCIVEMNIKDSEKEELETTEEFENYEARCLTKLILKELKKNNLTTSKGFEAKYNFDLASYKKNSTSIAFELLTLKGINNINSYELSSYDMENINENIQILDGKGYRGTSESFMMNMCKENHGHVLYCQSLKHECIPVNYDGYSIIASYNDCLSKRNFEDEKIRQCNDALQKFQKVVNISSLCNLSIAEFEKFKGVLDKDTLKVASYVVYENYRVRNSIPKLKDGNMKEIGILMKKTHEELKNLYGIVNEEHDFIFKEALKIDGCIGSKMSESSLGLCNLSIVKDEVIDDFKEKVGDEYKIKYNEGLNFYVQSLKNK
ncbi:MULTISPECIES: hypothetical protein [Clostridium]|uniref:Galactokinase n=1 Tax=Clostridium cadaveris TaxID=1529 RepID=A0A1I2LT37_9CLOT|nr:hypothetical protein [Clostridium cadaveris]MDU4951118.1 hypothetical protein [Clostridium sp.]MDM8312992.1 hypothetical protein [Clostridium cadaveris]MDY4948832.1 hypothetical protein [Clostridium cadaveris]NME63072.1 hypothetical protein [Clostridium cadaveris]NWK10055.1 hypothetical protein [Clostridium cadaveris]